MSIVLQSSRFGEVRIAEEQVLRFPRGLVGIPGSDYVLIDAVGGGLFRWLHSLTDGGLALPVADPYLFVPDFALQIADADCEEIGIADPADVQVLATVAARPDPSLSTINLRAPLLIHRSLGYQVINQAPGASLRAPLIAGEPAISAPAAR